MTKKNVSLEIQDDKIMVAVANKLNSQKSTEYFEIPLASRVLINGVVMDNALLQSAFEVIVNRLGKKAVYHLLLSHDQTLVKSVPLPDGMKKADYEAFILHLLPRLFSLSTHEIVYDYQIRDDFLFILIARKQIIVSWCQFFSVQRLKLVTIATRDELKSGAKVRPSFIKQLIYRRKDGFNLLPLQKKIMVLHLSLNLLLFTSYLSLLLCSLYFCWQHFHKKQWIVLAKFHQLVKLEQQKEQELQTISNLENKLNKVKQRYHKKINLIENNTKPLAIFSGIQSAVSEDIFLSEINYQGKWLKLFGKSFDYLLFKKMMRALGKLPFAARCRIKQLSVDNNVLVFELEIKLKDQKQHRG